MPVASGADCGIACEECSYPRSLAFLAGKFVLRDGGINTAKPLVSVAGGIWYAFSEPVVC